MIKYLVLVSVFCLLTVANADSSIYFSRDAKWTNLAPSGGSLVSGRGNFRPGFYRQGAADPRMYMAEPLFAFKRSKEIVPSFES
uniref:Uncharacterized protein n=1 Tax=Panagrolaimus sp. JU765 TaxID=591449 RepID=A0AC34QHA2_9BILA